MPTPLTEGVTLYEHPRFEGASIVLTADVQDLDDVENGCFKSGGPSSDVNWDDCVSSIRVAPGWTATIHEDPHYRGASLIIMSDVEDLDDLGGPCGDDWDDCISSLRVRRQ
jgi:hypothetical protein